MSRSFQWILSAAICLLANQTYGQTSIASCGVDSACASSHIPTVPQSDRPESVQHCPGVMAYALGGSVDERRLACNAVMHAVQELSGCGIKLQRALQIRIMSEVRNPHGALVFGLFDPKQESILVTDEANLPPLRAGTPYAELPLSDFYKSLIVHEAVHGVMHQNQKRAGASYAAYEYPAYALQIKSLTPAARNSFLRPFDQAAVVDGSAMFTDAILFFDPYFFAARAYHHFTSSTDGCAHLVALLDGEVTFIAHQM